MRTVMSAQQMRSIDKYMIETLQIPGILLMENAAMATADAVAEACGEDGVVHVFCGTGNNGGDGLACARILLGRGYDVYVVLAGPADKLTDEARINYTFFDHFPARLLRLDAIEDLYGWHVPRADVIVDALFGTGLTRDVHGMYADVITAMNSATAVRVAADMPSGIETDTGRVMGHAVKADCTVTFQYPKLGQFLYPGRSYCGQLKVAPIGVAKGAESTIKSSVTVLEPDDTDMVIPARMSDTNKGSYGRLLVLAGSRGMAGAAVMCARAAYAAGAGLVNVGGPWAVVDVMQSAVPEATCTILPEEEGQLYAGSAQAIEKASTGKTAIAVGPGLGNGRELKSVISEILTSYDVCRVVDADALNVLDNDLKVLAHSRGDVIFTPHPAEFARLLGTRVQSVLEHPLELAAAFAQKCRVIVVLKGATTIIADPSGKVTLVPLGSPGMAKGGSGDVLTGVIAALAAQGAQAYEAAVLGVYLCATAGSRAAAKKGEYSMTPLDTVRELGEVMEDCIVEGLPAWHAGGKDKSQPDKRGLSPVTESETRSLPMDKETKPIPQARESAEATTGRRHVSSDRKLEPEEDITAAAENDQVSGPAGRHEKADSDAAGSPAENREAALSDSELKSGAVSPATVRNALQQQSDTGFHSRRSLMEETNSGEAAQQGIGDTRRMSATDIRPPRLPRTAGVDKRDTRSTAGTSDGSGQQAHSLLGSASIGESTGNEDVTSDSVTAAERRSQLNDEIKRELKNREKSSSRTRRRIG